MAHKKSLLCKYFSESDCRSPRHDGHNWLIPETSLSEPSGEDSGNNIEVMKSGSTSTVTNVTNKSGSTSTDSNETIIVTSTPVKRTPHL